MSANHTKSVVVLVMLAGLGVLLTGCPDDVVFFPDEDLELEVRRELQQPFGLINKESLLKLLGLDARNKGVQDLEGLQYARNLLRLDLSNESSGGTGITDITPLSGLRNLVFLDLSFNDISDVSAVAGLLSLGELRLTGNNVFNIEPILTNAQSGGLGSGDSVSLSLEPLRDANGDIPSIVAGQIAQLQSLGVLVVFD